MKLIDKIPDPKLREQMREEIEKYRPISIKSLTEIVSKVIEQKIKEEKSNLEKLTELKKVKDGLEQKTNKNTTS